MQEGMIAPSSTVGPRIVIVNFHSTHNAGDLALLKMNMRQLQHGFGNPTFTVTANYPDEARLNQIGTAEIIPSAFAITGANRGAPLYMQLFRLMVGIIHLLLGRFFARSYQKWMPGSPWKRLITAFWQADMVAGVSGNYLLSMGNYGWPFPLTAFAVFAAILFRKPFYAMPQSIGPFRRGWERAIVRWLFRRAKRVFLRDQVSVDLAKELGLPQSRVQFIPDPAFGLPAASREEALQILSRYGHQPGQQAIGITVIAPLSRALSAQVIASYYQGLASVVFRFAREYGVQVYIFNQVTGPMEREDDRTAGRTLLRLMPQDQTEVVLVDAVLEPEQLKACYGLMNLMIASRLHSAIFAMGAGVATVSVGYFTKTRGLLQAMGLEKWLVALDQADAETLWQKITEAWGQRKELAAEIQTKAGDYADMTLLLGEQIREDYQQGQKGLRVIQLIKGLDIGEIHGGSELFGMNLACALHDTQAEVVLCILYKMGTEQERKHLVSLEQKGIRLLFLQDWEGETSLGSFYQGARKLASFLKDHPADVLHSHFQVGTFLAILLKLTGHVRSIVRTVHVNREWERGWNGLVQQLIIRSFISVLFPLFVDIEASVSGSAAEVLNRRLVARMLRKRSPVIYNSIPLDWQPQQDTPAVEPDRRDKRFIVGTVGRLTEQKGHSYLLEAIPHVLKEVPEAAFWMIGDGPLMNDLHTQARQLGIENAIQFMGKRDDVHALFDQMDLFVLPSLYEGLPTVVLESMAHQVPVLGTTIAGTRELIQHQKNGWLVPACDPQALVQAILYALRHPEERDRVAHDAWQTVQEFRIEVAAQKYISLYQTLA